MKINRNNYELFFVDYLDGKLSHSDELELLAFLAANPDLEEELNLVRDIKIEPEKITFNAKDSLKKKEIVPEISQERFNELCVGKIENILNAEEEKLLINHIQLHPELEKDLRLFNMTVSQPDYTIEFPGKESLKRMEISTENINELLVGRIENDLNEKQEAMLTKQLKQNPGLEKELQLFNQTILKPDMSIVFPGKSSLKRKAIQISYRKIIIRSVSAAAAIALLFVLYTNFNNEERFGNSTKMFTGIFNPLKIKTNQVQLNNTEKKNKTNNIQKTIQNNQQLVAVDDTSTEKVKNNSVITSDNTNNFIAANNNQLIDTTSHHQVPVKNVVRSNQNLDKTYEAIFADAKYSHYRDMIESVPYQTIQSGPSVGIWDIVEAGSKGISAVTGADVNFDQKIDKKRKVEKYSFHVGRFGFSRTVHK